MTLPDKLRSCHGAACARGWRVRRQASVSQVAVRSSADGEHGEHVIPFEKWRHCFVQKVPKTYLQLLRPWDKYKTTQKNMLRTACISVVEVSP